MLLGVPVWTCRLPCKGGISFAPERIQSLLAIRNRASEWIDVCVAWWWWRWSSCLRLSCLVAELSSGSLRVLFWCHSQIQSTTDLDHEASIDGPELGSTSAGLFRPPKRCPPTVGGHRLGGVFLSWKRPPFWGRPLGRVQERVCAMVAAVRYQLCLSLPTIAEPVRGHQSPVPDGGGGGAWWWWWQQVM